MFGDHKINVVSLVSTHSLGKYSSLLDICLVLVALPWRYKKTQQPLEEDDFDG